MPKKTDDNTEARRHLADLMITARTQIESSTAALELAYYSIKLTGIANPVLEELREAILLGRKMTARAQEILRRIP